MKNIYRMQRMAGIALMGAFVLWLGIPLHNYALAASVGAAATTSTAVCSTSTELLGNGDFEAPVVTQSDKWDIFQSGNPALVWSVDWMPGVNASYNGINRPNPALLEVQQNGHLGFTASHGTQFVELDSDWFGPNPNPQSEPASVNIYQDIQTIPGADYTLKFDFAARPDAPQASENMLRVRWNNSDVDNLTLTGSSPTTIDWKSYTYTVHATASTTRVEFADTGVPDSVGTFLDNVSLICANAPANGGGNNGGGNGTTTATSTINVIMNVINNDGGVATSSDFILSITGTNASTSTFPGSVSGTVVTFDPGVYAIVVTSTTASTTASSTAYTTTYSPDCTGIIAAGTALTCTVTSDDVSTSTTSVGSNGGGTGGNGGGSNGGSSGSNGSVAPQTGSSGGGNGGSSVGASSGGAAGGTGNGLPTGPAVLGASTGYPDMPSTAGGNPWMTYILSFAGLLLAVELSVRLSRKNA